MSPTSYRAAPPRNEDVSVLCSLLSVNRLCNRPKERNILRLNALSNALKRRAGPAGSWLNRSTAFLVAVWMTHALLRAFLLFRKDAFGFSLVGKADWYIFHALFLDLHWIFLWSFPFLFLLVLCSRFAPRLSTPIFILLILFHAGLLLFTVIDQETLRFMGTHFDQGFAEAYGNTASVRQVFHFIAADKSIPYLPYFLFFGCIPCTLLFFGWLKRNEWVRSQKWSLKPVAWILGGCLIGYLYVYQIWTGYHRMARLRPFVQSVYLSMGKKDFPDLPPDSIALLGDRYHAFWRAGGGDSDWTFPRTDYPYFREPIEAYCKHANPKPLVCNEDKDGDGYSKSVDCLDANPNVHPGTVDIPGNGVDEDCDGTDAKPWNFVLLVLESHRALNTGHLVPYGAVDSATPFLDSLAHAGHYWTRMITSGLPTIHALMSIHLSIPQHPTRFISSEFTHLSHRSFTTVLARHGYKTHYFSAADPAWDNETPWLRQWYQDITYNRDQENDGAMLGNMSRWMRDSLSTNQPFLMTAMTKTNHYPFNNIPGGKPMPPNETINQNISHTMAYTDSCMRVFVNSLRNQPWFDHTVFIVIADHGFPLGEHGFSNIGYGLYTENVWLPFVIAGAHPKLGTPRAHDDLAAHADLGSTVLDLAGIREANAYLGHSLLQPANPEHQFSVLFREEQAIVEHGPYRWHGAWGSIPRVQGEEMFDVVQDRLERHNLLETRRSLGDSLKSLGMDLARLHLHVVEKNRLWPDSL